jgi:hypothetical protein
MTRLMVAALLAALTTQPASADQMGYAARYRPGLMERAAQIHGVSIPPGRELCSSPTERLGTLLTVTSRISGSVWRCVVVDIAHARDRASILRRGIVIELPPIGAMHLCGSVRGRPSDCPVRVEHA